MKSIKIAYDINEETKIIDEFTSPGDPFGGAKVVYETHHSLEGILTEINAKDAKKRLSAIKEVLENYYLDKSVIAKRNDFKKLLTAAWSPVEQDLLDVLYGIFEISLSEKPDTTAFMCSIGIYPRDIDEKIFFVGFQQQIYDAMTTIVHEYTHFLYFDSWKKLFPNDMPQASWGPSTLWKLSEVIAVVINQDERILRILPEAGNQDFYFDGRSYYGLPMPDGSNNSVLGYFKKLYLDHKYSKGAIDEFLSFCRREALRLDL